MREKRLIEIYHDFATDGVFKDLAGDVELPWHDLIRPEELDIEYIGGHSGGKLISPLLHNLLEDDGTITAANRLVLTHIIHSRYLLMWTKRFETLTFDYNPLENYNMIEKLDGGSKNTAGGKDTTTPSGSVKNATDVFGYNSSTAVPDSQTTQSYQNAKTEVSYGRTDTETHDHTLTRSGNIGVTTSQQMLESQRAVLLWDFFETVFSDLDKILTQPIFD